jgi:CheY-like chemotaxis protein
MQTEPTRQVSRFILVAEDEDSDFFLLSTAAEQVGLVHRFYQVRSGRDLLDYLAAKGPYANRQACPVPDLLIVDLKMPGVTGFDVLDALQKSHELSQFPVVVLSGSDFESDRARAEQLGARAYYVKRCGIESTRTLVYNICHDWLDHPPKTLHAQEGGST